MYWAAAIAILAVVIVAALARRRAPAAPADPCASVAGIRVCEPCGALPGNVGAADERLACILKRVIVDPRFRDPERPEFVWYGAPALPPAEGTAPRISRVRALVFPDRVEAVLTMVFAIDGARDPWSRLTPATELAAAYVGVVAAFGGDRVALAPATPDAVAARAAGALSEAAWVVGAWRADLDKDPTNLLLRRV